MEIKYSKIMPVAGAMICALAAQAQYDQTIDVDGRYVPDVVRMERINTFPQVMKFTLAAASPECDMRGVVADFNPFLLPQAATGWNDNRVPSTARGYLDLNMGSWLTSGLSAGYRIVDDGATVAGVRLQHNSTSLWRPDQKWRISDSRRYRYDETLGLYGSHNWDGAGTLAAALDYHIANFNYYAYNPTVCYPGVAYESQSADAAAAPTQTLNNVALRIGWQSVPQQRLSWNAEAMLRYFGYRSFYLRDNYSVMPQRFKGARETLGRVSGALSYGLGKSSRIGLDVDMNVVGYAAYSPELTLEDYVVRPDTYGLITLLPHYRLTRNRLNLLVGLNVDVAARAGLADARYSTLHVAPLFNIDYQGNGAALYLHLDGGSRLHTLADSWQYDYYSQPLLLNTTPEYTPLNLMAGVTFGPFGGFRGGLRAGWRITQHQYMGGCYFAQLNYGSLPLDYGNDVIVGDTSECSYMADNTMSLHGWTIGLDFDWELGRLFKLKGDISYQDQDGETGYFNGYDRPRVVTSLNASLRPVEPLTIDLDWSLRALRRTYFYQWTDSWTGYYISDLVSVRLPNLSRLSAGITYKINSAWHVSLRGYNLLNRHEMFLPGQPDSGLTVTAGFGVVF